MRPRAGVATLRLRWSVPLLVAVLATVVGSHGPSPAGAYPPGPASTECTVSLFGNTLPATASAPDGRAVELGVKLRSKGRAVILGLRFYKSPENTGPHVGRLWTTSGEVLRTVTFGNETSSGWQESIFETPVVAVEPTTFVASYFAPNGHYAFEMHGLDGGLDRGGPLYIPPGGPQDPNSVYLYAPGGGFPTSTYQGSNYYVDVIFHDTTPPPDPEDVDSPASTPQAVLLRWTEPPPRPVDHGVSKYLIFRNGYHLADVAAGVTSFTDRTVSPGAAYEYTVRSSDACGNLSEGRRVSVRTPGAVQTIFGSRAPAGPTVDDRLPVEIGVKFQSAVPGSVSAIRFYRHTAIDAGYTATLWTSDGRALASGRVVEGQGPVPGYQEVQFAPVPISPNTIYVASYFASKGGYAFEAGGLAEAVRSGDLTALGNEASGGNGVYRYGAAGGFPTETFNAANYWVDVRFTPST
jgi:hypothetical protein